MACFWEQAQGVRGQRRVRVQPSRVLGHSQDCSALSLGFVRTLFPAPEGRTHVFQDTWQVCPCPVTRMGILQVLPAQQLKPRLLISVPPAFPPQMNRTITPSPNPGFSSLFLPSHVPSTIQSCWQHQALDRATIPSPDAGGASCLANPVTSPDSPWWGQPSRRPCYPTWHTRTACRVWPGHPR